MRAFCLLLLGGSMLAACGGSPTAPAPTAPAAPTPATTSATAPVITAFTADRNGVDPGGSTTLRWTISNATTASIDNGVGTVSSAAGSATVSPKADPTVYKLTATNGTGTVSSTVTVGVATLPTITSFTSNFWSGYSFDRAQLAWSISNATTATIDNGVNSVDPRSGTVLVSPADLRSPSDVDPSKTYTLTAANSHGSVSATVRLTVVPDLEYRFFLKDNPAYAGLYPGLETLLFWDPVAQGPRGSEQHGSGWMILPRSQKFWGVQPGQKVAATVWVGLGQGGAGAVTVQILRRGHIFLQGDTTPTTNANISDQWLNLAGLF